MNPWVIAFPCLVYLASIGAHLCLPRTDRDTLNTNGINIAAGIMALISDAGGCGGYRVPTSIDFGLLYLSISVSLNVLLTLMIVTRFILHGRNIRAATGSPAGISGLYKAIATMFIESSALYAVSSMLAIGLWVTGNHAANAFLPILAETQVRTFPRPGIRDRSHVNMDNGTGHRSTTHHPTNRQPERIRE